MKTKLNSTSRILTILSISAVLSLILALIIFVPFTLMSQNGSFNIKSYGAKGDGTSKDTHAIQSAIDAAYNAGGGKVEVPPGVYLTGSIFLKSNVEFHIHNGATIKGSPDKEDYHAPDICSQNSVSPINVDNVSGSHLILSIAQTNIVISGNGKIDGNSSAFLLDKNGKHFPSTREIVWRPAQMLWFVDSSKIKIKDVEIANSPYWSCFILNCTHVAITGCNIHTSRKPHTYNGDGIDIDRCQYVTISDCRISTSDDCITLRASYTKHLENPQDCAYVTVANCTLSSNCNAIRLGVGEGHIHHATFSNLIIHDTRTAFNFVSSYSKLSSGTDITDIRTSNIIIDANEFCRIHHMYSKTAKFSNLYFSDISGNVKTTSKIYAASQTPFESIYFRNVDLSHGYEAINAPKIKVQGGTFTENKLDEAEIRKRKNEIDSNIIRMY